jgi:hypothetical protein
MSLSDNNISALQTQRTRTVDEVRALRTAARKKKGRPSPATELMWEQIAVLETEIEELDRAIAEHEVRAAGR